MTRKEAQALGLKRYAGKSCPRGHDGQRLVSNRACIECNREASVTWCQNNLGKARAINKRSRERHREQRLSTTRAWRRANPEYVSAKLKAWRQKNPDLYRATIKLWQEANPERVRRHKITRRARKAKAPGYFAIDDVQALLNKQRGQCLCGVSFSVKPHTIDHKTPLSRGGSNWPRNLQLLCGPCNSSKGTKTQAEWVASW